MKSIVQILHQWLEWTNLIECLMRQDYFDVYGNSFNSKTNELDSKEVNCICTACLNFDHDNSDLIRFYYILKFEV